MKKHLIISTGLALVLTLALSAGYLAVEPTETAAVADTVVVTLTVDAGITISTEADTAMSQNLGVSSHTAVGTTTWTVATNNSAGYTMTLAASTVAAMKSGTNYVYDYATTSAPLLWSVTSGNAAFGFSVNGTDVNSTKWGVYSYCGTAGSPHVPHGSAKYSGFTTAATTTNTRSSTTTSSGVATNVCYAVEQDTYYIPSGVYTATITATATTL